MVRARGGRVSHKPSEIRTIVSEPRVGVVGRGWRPYHLRPVGPDFSYEAVRHLLIAAYSVPSATQFRTIVQPGGMGDRTPLRLLRDMWDVYPESMPDSTLQQFWLTKLPIQVQAVIAGLSGSTDELAERADHV